MKPGGMMMTATEVAIRVKEANRAYPTHPLLVMLADASISILKSKRMQLKLMELNVEQIRRRNEFPRCPYCGHEHREWDLASKTRSSECESCQKTFYIKPVDSSIVFTTWSEENHRLISEANEKEFPGEAIANMFAKAEEIVPRTVGEALGKAFPELPMPSLPATDELFKASENEMHTPAKAPTQVEDPLLKNEGPSLDEGLRPSCDYCHETLEKLIVYANEMKNHPVFQSKAYFREQLNEMLQNIGFAVSHMEFAQEYLRKVIQGPKDPRV